MFRIAGFVDDKHIAAVMHAVAGLVRDWECVPVANVKVEKGKVAAKTDGCLAKLLHQTTGKDAYIKPVHVRMFVQEHGRAPSTAAYLMNKAIKLRLFKRVGKGSSTRYMRLG